MSGVGSQVGAMASVGGWQTEVDEDEKAYMSDGYVLIGSKYGWQRKEWS